MIELNLLPEELKARKKKSLDLAAFPVVPAFLGIIAVLAIAHLLVFFLARINKSDSIKLKKEWEEFAPRRKEITFLKGKVKEINTKVQAIEELTEKRILWAKKLNDLSDSMPQTTWLSEIAYSKKSSVPTLVIEGYTTGTEDDVGRFMKALKNNKDFFSDVHGIQLDFTKVGFIQNKEVTVFRLICTFKEAK